MTSHCVELFKRETTFVSMENVESISTRSILRGTSPIEFLKQRVGDILQLNPWLNGRLEKKEEKIVLRYSDIKTEEITFATSGVFQIVEHHDFSGNIDDNNKEFKFLEKFIVKKGNQVLNKNLPLFQVILSKLNDNKFVLFVSLSHILGDGHSYYNIFKMLSTDTTPMKLTINRALELENEINDRISPQEKLINSTGLALNMITSALFSKKPSIQRYKVNQDWVFSEKENYKKNSLIAENDTETPSFISTNDIICSEFFKTTECSLGLMAINLRGKIKELTDNHVGNYECAAAYPGSSEKYSPVFIRKGLKQFYGTKPEEEEILPGFFNRFYAKISLITNWASFYHELVFNECEFLEHEPVITTQVPFSFAVIYMRKKGDYGILSFENNSPIFNTTKFLKF